MDSRRILISIIILVLLLRFVLIFVNEGLWWDEAVYLGLADNIKEFRYSLSESEPVESFRPPLFPLLLAMGFDSILPARILTWFFGMLSVYGTYLLGRRFLNEEHSLIAAAFLSSFPLLIFFGNKILTESLFVTLLSFSLLFYLKSFEVRRYSILAGALTGILIMTRYFGLIVVFLCSLYYLYRKSYRHFLFFSLALLIIISPWLIFNQMTFGNPIGAMIINYQIYSSTPPEPWYLLFKDFFYIFGPVGFLSMAGILLIFRNIRENRDFHILFLLSILPIVAFFAAGHKEHRYLVSFFPIYALTASYFMNYFKDFRKPLLVISMILVLVSAGIGAKHVWDDREGGKALLEASLYLRNNTPEDSVILSEFYSPLYPRKWSALNPWVEYVGKRKVVLFPENISDMEDVLNSADYALIYSFGPRVPEYAAEYVEKSARFVEVARFSQWGKNDAVKVYRVV
ncbi:MAG: hypothetical protein DRP11_03410 [Candidatus Aenigmatarchaeota archaeon]|nr:MAG: hypothetical protein DRP11_03410 [Candidatus Aenigmarchaeota archaeon]